MTAISGCARSINTSSQDKVIIIGTDLATSGADAAAGIPTQNGAVLAIEQEAEHGLPGGYTIRAQTEDDTVNGVHDPAQGVRNVQTLLQDSRVLAIVGGMNSSVARAEIPVANGAEIALVSPTATSVGLTDNASGAAELRRKNPHVPTFFRVVVRDDLQGAADADFAYESLRARRAYVIDDNESYGRGIADVFAHRFAADGAVVVERSHLTKGQQDFIALLTRAAGLQPDLIFYGGVVSTGGAQLRRQMVQLSLNAKLMGGDGLWDPGFITAAGPDANGVYCSKGAPNLTVMASAQRFLRDYAARFPGQPTGTYSANSYAAAQVAVDAIRRLMERNGGIPPSREEVALEIAASTPHQTPIGLVSFNSNGDITSPVVSMWVVKDDRFDFITQRQSTLR